MQILGIEPRSLTWKANNLTFNIYLHFYFIKISECSTVGSVLGLGLKRRVFDSRHSDKRKACITQPVRVSDCDSESQGLKSPYTPKLCKKNVLLMKSFIIFEQYIPIYIFFIIAAVLLVGNFFITLYLCTFFVHILSNKKIKIINSFNELKNLSVYKELPFQITGYINLMFESLIKTLTSLINKTNNVSNIIEFYILYTEFKKYLKQESLLINYVRKMFF